MSSRAGLICSLAALSWSCPTNCPEEEFDCRGVCVLEGSNGPQHCGFGELCHDCPEQPFPNTMGFCSDPSQGHCDFMCRSGFADCNGRRDDGCETTLWDDPANCGSCGNVCHGVCAGGACTTKVAEGESDPAGLAVSEAGIFWAARSGDSLQIRQGHTDGTAPTVVASVDAPRGEPVALAIAGNNLFWTTGSYLQPDGGGGAIYRLQLSGGGSAAQLAAAQDAPGALVALPDHVYWTNFGGGQVMRLVLDGGTAEEIASGQLHPRTLIEDEGQLYWVNEGADGGGGAVMSLHLDGRGAPVRISDDGTLSDGGTVPTASAPTAVGVVRTLPDPLATGFTARVVCWTDRAQPVIWATTGGAPFALTFPQAPWDPRQLIGGSETIYLLDTAAGALERLDRLYILGSPDYAPPFRLFSLWLPPMSSPVLAAMGGYGIGWIDGSNIWLR